ncbi:hypothetical protein TREMEDRAFT_55980 [Tremella mesenterica DSM 1558]|uniref:uncharacterized protein n=1 Tax=Tremella mesenterica (strain ATCC 24925 / CBS 8224 / DSM 1558 / NBRC 9311 / NRRL Y-6157 / RJB 2259-6 / UBC 559-6) TaxID=578456 RepID=UPI0003F4A01C|nr:uncharacterized protein TREMEDRAFT_55980 [Tremella mesenterica DSM 1558]EIW72617.1 hypothetical protein TREMEDRAFT_55980 [Tremella mesenterica DSM 1558]
MTLRSSSPPASKRMRMTDISLSLSQRKTTDLDDGPQIQPPGGEEGPPLTYEQPASLPHPSSKVTNGKNGRTQTPWPWKDTTIRTEVDGTDVELKEWRNMVAGRVYRPGDPYIHSQRLKIMRLVKKANKCEDWESAAKIQKEICGAPDDTILLWQCPFFVQFIRRKVLISPGSHILDCCPITIGTRTMIGANATIISGGHTILPSNRWPESGNLLDPTADDCWLGANVTVLQGVRIGDGCTIGAGSVVVKDIPDR